MPCPCRLKIRMDVEGELNTALVLPANTQKLFAGPLPGEPEAMSYIPEVMPGIRDANSGQVNASMIPAPDISPVPRKNHASSQSRSTLLLHTVRSSLRPSRSHFLPAALRNRPSDAAPLYAFRSEGGLSGSLVAARRMVTDN